MKESFVDFLSCSRCWYLILYTYSKSSWLPLHKKGQSRTHFQLLRFANDVIMIWILLAGNNRKEAVSLSTRRTSTAGFDVRAAINDIHFVDDDWR